ncbi:MAG TPA: MFS transporter [Gemmataceae bacterium]|nr:MFS transporter [Gemmataceae bacterium]
MNQQNSSPESPPPQRRALVEAIVASTIGTTIEWYDFFLYGTAAALVFPELFFPKYSAFAGQVLSFTTYAVGFVARPVGGAIFGYLGDRIGRKSTLVATLLLMGVSTLIIGFLPTYQQIGSTSALILAFLRILQGIGVGGEWGGAVLLAVETGHQGKRGFYGSWPQAGVPLGLLSSTAVVAACQRIWPGSAFIEFGWRVPFFLSGLLIVFGLLIRLRILESPLFARLQDRKELAADPIGETLRRHWREILLAAGSRISEQSCFYLFTVYVLTHVKNVLQMDAELVLGAINVAAALEFFTIPVFGILSDHLMRRRVYMFGCLFLIGFAFPYFGLLASQNTTAIWIAIIISLAIGHALLYSVQASLIPELFGTRLRYTGASLGYQLASPVAGGLAPIIATALAEFFPGHYWPLAGYIILISIISLVCVWCLAETSKKDISLQD